MKFLKNLSLEKARILLGLTTSVFIFHIAYAVELPLPVSTDERIKIVPYEKNNIVPIFVSFRWLCVTE